MIDRGRISHPSLSLSPLGVVYRDLKPENCLLGHDGYICVADFGLSRQGSTAHYSQAEAHKGDTRERLYSVVGTPEYIAPEVLLKKGHGKPVDWWTLGDNDHIHTHTHT